MTRAVARERVRWSRGAMGIHAHVGRALVVVVREPGTREWRADVRTRGARWASWRRSEAAARRAGIELARALAGG